MSSSLAQIPLLQRSAGHWALLCLLAGCASLPPPTSELTAAQRAVEQAGAADADQYAPDLLQRARGELEQAQAAMAARRDDPARQLAAAAAADADLARERSQLAVLRATLAMRKDEIRSLKQRLAAPATLPAPLAAPGATP
jgi:hypothetical protein